MPVQSARHSSLLISSLLSAMLYGVVVCKIWEYLGWYPASRDAHVRDGLLFCCTVTSSIAMVAQLTNVYYLTVTFWGNTVAIRKLHWPVSVYADANSVTGVMVESRLQFLVGAIMIAVHVTMASVPASSIKTVISSARNSSVFGIRETMQPPLPRFGPLVQRFQALGSLSPDILIAVETDNDEDVLQKNQLVSALSCATLGDPSDPPCENRLINLFVVGAVQTGSTTSTVALAGMVSYYILDEGSNDSNLHYIPGFGGTVPTAIYYLISPLYMLTLLYNFNLRRYCDGINVSVSGGTDTRLTGPDAMGMDDIHIHRTAIISIDRPDGDASHSRVDLTNNSNSQAATKLSQDAEGGPSVPKGGRAGHADL
ncbi:hypothetical protein DFH08DRAFT_824756 [Mycena albidolilacea]|uniref:Uncharacterized protein n=1 Tax=Mycena albidolilacea TaxID=1033008 RepID=A0AAD6Z3X0_9AGAR|nr:hypothetical protein DFH08DRAFT_824756 [Mycena albidolilacea]